MTRRTRRQWGAWILAGAMAISSAVPAMAAEDREKIDKVTLNFSYDKEPASGDEIGDLNDYSYKSDPAKAADSRYVHRGKFHWEAAERRKEQGAVEQVLFDGIGKLERLRRDSRAFLSTASVRTAETHDPALLCLVRELEGEKLTAVFNFSREPRTAWIREGGDCRDLLSGERLEAENVAMGPFQARWLLQK